MSANFKTISKSLNSYRRAFKEITDICPNLDLNGSGCPTTDILSGRIAPLYGSINSALTKHATKIFCTHESLFDCGRAKNIEPSYWIWTSDFFKTWFYIERPFIIYTLESGKIRESKQTLTLTVRYKNWGLANWKKNQKEIKELFKDAPEKLQEEYTAYLKKANDEIDRWNKAVSAASIKKI